MIMCAADDSIEKPKKVIHDGKVWWGVDGVGAAHQCKDPRPLWEMLHRSEKEPVDLSRWQDGIAAREYFWEELKDGYRYDIPYIWNASVIGSLLVLLWQLAKLEKGGVGVGTGSVGYWYR
ncbi:hypothetical protein BJY01DRAFT_43079 [Aspergillus pseudoustus]|uniref:Uncharacterized protein n=1 Tax=Aspergillus pseudoustus TaxID=1810923 RepID=A0ABR4KSJ9_9EURO